MKRRILFSLLALFVMMFAMLHLYCEIFDPPTAPEKTKVSVIFKAADNTIFEGSIVDSVGKQFEIGAALYLPDNFDSLSLKVVDGGNIVIDTMFRTFKNGYFYDTVWLSQIYWTPGIRNVTLTPYTNPERPAIVTTISILGVSMNTAPKWSVDTLKKTIKVGSPLYQALSEICTDAENDILTYTLIPGAPDNDTIINTTYQFTPELKDVGTQIAHVKATDPAGSFSIIPVKITVDNGSEDKAPPEITFITPLDTITTVSVDSFTIDLLCTDASGIAAVSAVLSTTTFQSTLKNGRYLISVKGFIKGTTNIVTITTKDSSALGNTNTRNLYFNYSTSTPPFTVTYNGNTNTAGAAPVDPGKYEIGANVTVKDNTGNMVKAGFTFVGWNTAVDGSGTGYAAGVTFPMETANITLYAQWTTKPTFTVTYNGNGNTGGAVPVDGNKYITDAKVTVKDNAGLLVKTGASFAGWNTTIDGSGTTYAGGGSFPMGSANVVLYAKWTTKPTFTVTFNSNGGSGTMTDLPIESGTSMPLTANAFTKSGSKFSGWVTTATGTTVEYADKANYTMGTSNVTLYAIWSQNAAYKVTFDSNSGTGTMADQSIVSGMSAPLTANAFTKTGSVFAGWSSIATGTTVEYADKASYTMVGNNVTLYVIWSQDAAYKITFNSNGGTGTMADQSIVSGISAPLTANAFTKSGSVFAGWATAATGTTVEYADKASYTMGESNVTLYAIWSQNAAYKITFNSNGGTGTMADQAIVQGMSASLTINAFTKSGSVFAGWATTATGTTVEYVDKVSYMMGESNVILYAIWSQNAAYKITFNSNGGTGTMADQAIVQGMSAPLTINAFTKSGSVFAGWASTATGTTVEYADKASYTMGGSNVTLYAIWSQNPAFKITFNSNGGTGTMVDHTIVQGTSTPLTMNAFTKSGSVFAGWASTATGTTVEYADKASYTMGGSNVTLYAIWSQNPAFKITFNSNGGTGTMADQSIVQGISTPLTANAFVKSGSTFAGWVPTATGTTVEYADKASYTMGGSNVTLYALWTQNPSYKITFNSNGGTGTMVQQAIVQGSNATLSVNTFTRAGHQFAGWATTPTGTVAYESQAVYTMGGGDVNLYAIWTQNPSYAITFNSNGGGGTMSPQSIVSGMSALLIANTFTKAGSTFAGWAISETGAVVYVDKASYTMGNSAVLLYAIWTVNNIAPAIVTHPAAKSVNQGGAVSFTAEINTDVYPAPTYIRWVKNNTDTISGATSLTLSLTGVPYIGAGNYKVVVKNSVGTAVSNNAALTVNDVTKPVLTLKGASDTTILLGSTWTDPKGTATDDKDGNIASGITLSGAPANTNSVGRFTITYNVSDAASNAATPVQRTLRIEGWESVTTIPMTYFRNAVLDGAENIYVSSDESIYKVTGGNAIEINSFTYYKHACVALGSNKTDIFTYGTGYGEIFKYNGSQWALLDSFSLNPVNSSSIYVGASNSVYLCGGDPSTFTMQIFPISFFNGEAVGYPLGNEPTGIPVGLASGAFSPKNFCVTSSSYVYSAGLSPDIVAGKCINSSWTFQTLEVLEGGCNYLRVVNYGNYGYIGYTKGADNNNPTVYQTEYGTNWTKVTSSVANNPSQGGGGFDIAVSGTGELHAAYIEGSNMLIKRYVGSSWVNIPDCKITASFTATGAQNPFVLPGTDVCYIVYHDGSKIYIKKWKKQ